jgi:hypothetical protein
MYGNDPTQQGGAMVGTATPAKKRSRKGLWITLGTIAALLVVGGGAGAFALIQYTAPAAAAGQFCNYLKAQNYGSAYGMLSANLKKAYTSEQFHTGNAALDAAEGKVTACGAASGSGSYDYSLGGSKATVKAAITRETQGSLQGNLQLVNESGWKVDVMETSLLGVNLSALQTLGAFCAALQSQNYTAAFGLLSSSLQTQAVSADIFTTGEQFQDQVDGKVTACAIKSIPSGNTDTSATVTATITRATLGARSGSISLDNTGGTWKISKFDDSLQGSNLEPLLTGTTFCLVLVANNDSGYSAAYALLSSGFQHGVTLAQFTQGMTAILHQLSADAKWTGCVPDLTTYKVTATSAGYEAKLNAVTGTGHEGFLKLKFAFVLEGTTWKIDDF